MEIADVITRCILRFQLRWVDCELQVYLQSKNRIGLDGREGNAGEDTKEAWFVRTTGPL